MGKCAGRVLLNKEKTKDPQKEERRNTPFDRRSGKDRRKAYKLGYFQEGGTERRSGKEQRSGKDRRSREPEAEKAPGHTSEEQDREKA
jgi:hypothetical protein